MLRKMSCRSSNNKYCHSYNIHIIITYINNCKQRCSDTRRREIYLWHKSGHFMGILCRKKISEYAKATIYNSVVRKLTKCGAQFCLMAGKHENALHSMEMKLLRWTVGQTRFALRGTTMPEKTWRNLRN